MQSTAATVEAYLDSLPADRREAIAAVRAVILENLDDDYEEGIQYGMIGYYVPHRVFPNGYHCDPRQPLPFAGLASQKNHMSLYLMGVYGSPEEEAWLRKAWAATGKRLDMGKACIRFMRLEDVPLEVIGEVIRRFPAKVYIERYQAALASTSKRSATAKKTNGSKPAAKPAAQKTVKKTAKKAAGSNSTKSAAKKPSARKAAGPSARGSARRAR